MTDHAPRPAWAAYGEELIRRLRRNPQLDRYPGRSVNKWNSVGPHRTQEHAQPGLLDFLNKRAPSYVDEESDEGDFTGYSDFDGDALDISMSEEDGPSPMQPIPHPTLSLALKLAATFGSEDAFIACFGAASSVFVLGNIEPREVALAQDLLTLIVMPPGWIVASEARMLKGEPNALCLLAPEITNGRVAERVLNIFGSDIRTALSLPDRLFVLVPRGCEFPPDLKQALPAPVPIAPLSRSVFGEHMRYSHGLADGKDQTLLERLPDEKALTELPGSVLSAALRAPTARGVVDRLSSAEKSSKRQKPDGPRLEDMDGNSPALQAARQLVADLAAWKEGTCEWSELTRSMILHGPPGTGKSWLARAMGASAGISFVQGSFAEWQSAGHLGDMLAAMRRAFTGAIAKKPSILFIDEVDAAGSRYDTDNHNSSYRRQVINAVLEQIDLLMREEGVLLIGACNDIHNLDPAILRPGRFDLKIEMPRPDRDGILSMLRQKLEHDGLGATDLDALARRSAGMTAADIDAGVRQARTLARAANRALSLADLERVFPSPASQDPERDWRIAVHEAGHAIVTQALGMGTVQRVALVGGGGVSVIDRMPTQGRICDIESALTCLMAGRAAEMLILGNISSGAGGPVGSDLEQATALALRIDTNFGIGEHGPTWLGDIATVSLRDPDQRRRVRARLEQAEQHASEILAAHQEILTRMARNLVHERELTGGPLQNLLSDVVVQSKASAPHQHATRADEDDTKKGTEMPIQEKTSC